MRKKRYTHSSNADGFNQALNFKNLFFGLSLKTIQWQDDFQKLLFCGVWAASSWLRQIQFSFISLQLTPEHAPVTTPRSTSALSDAIACSVAILV